MNQATAADLTNVLRSGIEAVEAGDFAAAEAVLEQAKRSAGENDAGVLHLEGLIAWAQGDVEHAMGFLMQAADLGPDRVDVYLDCAECMLEVGEDLEEAEAAVRVALQLPNITDNERHEAQLLLAQLQLSDDRPNEALESLAEVSGPLQEHPAYLSTKAAILLALERADEAAALLEKVIAIEPDEPDFHYQLGITRKMVGDEAAAAKAMLRVLELDSEVMDERDPPTYAEAQELRTRLEDVLEDLPEPLLRLVANAPIRVQARPSSDEVRAGVDPRAIVAFVGTPKRDDEEPELQGIVVFRDHLLDEVVDDDDEVGNVLFYGLMEEIRDFFKREDVVYALADN